MFMRLVHHKAKPEELPNLQGYYQNTVVPVLQKTPGCISACLIRGVQQANEVISLTLWDTQQHAQTYEKSGVFEKLLGGMRPYLAESSEWKIQLTKELTLEYAPVPEEPVVRSYSVAAASNRVPVIKESPGLMYTRIVSVKLKPGMFIEYKHLYDEVVIPALRKTTGCRYAYLIESTEEENEALSITIWDSKEHADEYERSGLFNHLIDKVKHTFSELYQWKMSLDRGKRESSKTSEDLEVSGFSVVAGKGFTEK